MQGVIPPPGLVRLGHGRADPDLPVGLDAMLPQDGPGVGQQAVLEVVVGPGPGDNPAP